MRSRNHFENYLIDIKEKKTSDYVLLKWWVYILRSEFKEMNFLEEYCLIINYEWSPFPRFSSYYGNGNLEDHMYIVKIARKLPLSDFTLIKLMIIKKVGFHWSSLDWYMSILVEPLIAKKFDSNSSRIGSILQIFQAKTPLQLDKSFTKHHSKQEYIYQLVCRSITYCFFYSNIWTR